VAVEIEVMARGSVRRAGRGIGITLANLTEESKFGQSTRRELIRWYPGCEWIERVDASPALRELAKMDRRRFLVTLGFPIATAAICGTAACGAGSLQALELLFQAFQIGAKLFSKGGSSNGTAVFDNNSQSREAFELISSLVSGTSKSGGSVQDKKSEDVEVPAGDDGQGYLHLVDGLVSNITGNHFFSGLAIGQRKDSDTFKYQ
jgi:hypothetical protein